MSVARLGRGAKGGDHPRLNVVATDLPIPWALVYDDAFLDGRPLNPATVDDVDIESFWGYRFRIDRSAPVSCDLDTDRTVGGPDVALRMCINRRIDQQAAGVVALQCDALKRLTEGQRFRLVQTIDSDAALTAWLEAADSSPGCDLLYFFCHARPAVDLDRTGLTRVQPNRKQAAVLLDAVDETGSGTSVEDLWEKRRQPVPNYPLVILNACGSGQGTESGVSPFVEVFLYRWAGRGFVGTDWTIPTGFADPFGRRLLARFAEGNTTIGAALHDTVREALDAGNPFGLIYCLYGRPDLAIVRV